MHTVDNTDPMTTAGTMSSTLASIVRPGHVAIAATIAAAVLVGWDLGARSLWLDEAYSVEIAGGTWAHLWERVTQVEASMTLYYVLLHEWLALFGRSEASMRAFSALMVVATVPMVYWVGARLVGTTAAATGVVILVTNAFLLRYGQDARSYTLAVLLVVASGLALLRAVERPTVLRWTLWVITAVLAVYAHTLAITVVGAQILAVMRRVPFTTLVSPVLALGVLVSPLFWFFIARDVGQVDWIPTPTLDSVVFVLGRLSGTDGRLGIALYAVCVLAAMWRGGFGVQFLASWAMVPFVVILAVSAVKPLFLDRYLIVLVPAAALLAGAGITSMRPRMLRIAAMVALVAWQAIHVPRVLRAPSVDDWRGAAAIVRAEQRPGDALVCWSLRGCVPFEYYLAPAPEGPPAIQLAEAADQRNAMAAIAAAHPRLWLTVSYTGTEERRALLARTEALLAESYVLVDSRHLPGIELRRYERTTRSNGS